MTVGLAVAVAACDGSSTGPAPGLPPPVASPSPSASTTPDAGDLLPIDAAIGEVMCVSFSGRRITPAIRHLIVDERAGAVLLFRGNFRDSADLAALVGELRELGKEAKLPAPLLVAVDEEGGAARTVVDGVPPLDSAARLGAAGPSAVTVATEATARGLHDLGIRLDLAPVADLRTNPADRVIGERSFGADPSVVGPLVAAAVNGLHEGGVAATLKHFPGLGGAAGDPHVHIPTDPVGLPAWTSGQRRTFAAGVAAGADAVMTTAVLVPGLDPSLRPALLSREVVTGMLRSGLGFGGVIVTDSLSLGGIGERYTLPQAAMAALGAGNDLLLLSNGDPAYEAEAIDAVRVAVRDGTIPAAQVQRSAARVRALSRRWGF